jgi:hypothetical protein
MPLSLSACVLPSPRPSSRGHATADAGRGLDGLLAASCTASATFALIGPGARNRRYEICSTLIQRHDAYMYMLLLYRACSAEHGEIPMPPCRGREEECSATCAISICVAGATAETSRAPEVSQAEKKTTCSWFRSVANWCSGDHTCSVEVCEVMNFRLLLQAGEGSWSEGKASKPVVAVSKNGLGSG